MWRSPLLSENFKAGAVISAYRFTKFGADDDHVILCNAATDGIIGVSQSVPAFAAEDPIDIDMAGIGEVELNATLARGIQVTADATGKAVAATDGDSVGGKILKSGVAGDIVPILLHAAGDSDAVPLLQADVIVSSAELLALNATPKELVAAPGAGYALILDSAILFLDYATTDYAGIAAGEDLTIKYTDASGAVQATIETTGFLDASADATRWVRQVTTAAFTPADNAALVLHLLVGEIITGDSPLKVRVFYKVIPTAL
jgi:hypothetical protein